MRLKTPRKVLNRLGRHYQRENDKEKAYSPQLEAESREAVAGNSAHQSLQRAEYQADYNRIPQRGPVIHLVYYMFYIV